MDEFDEQIRIWKIRVEQINRTLSHPGFNPASREGYQLIEEKQTYEREIANVERIRQARKLAESVSSPGETDSRPPTVGSSKGVSSSTKGAEAGRGEWVGVTPAAVPVSRTIERGKFCEQVINEIKRIRNLHLGSGMSVAEIQKENPEWTAWKVRESLRSEDRETFNHPRQWGPPVGYARLILSKVQEVSVHTVKAWVKAYSRSLRMK